MTHVTGARRFFANMRKLNILAALQRDRGGR
jgi:hypothetical protein